LGNDKQRIASNAIKTGTSDGINVEILSGLSEGEEVVYN
jgi:HlyD family secretion protein